MSSTRTTSLVIILLFFVFVVIALHSLHPSGGGGGTNRRETVVLDQQGDDSSQDTAHNMRRHSRNKKKQQQRGSSSKLPKASKMSQKLAQVPYYDRDLVLTNSDVRDSYSNLLRSPNSNNNERSSQQQKSSKRQQQQQPSSSTTAPSRKNSKSNNNNSTRAAPDEATTFNHAQTFALPYSNFSRHMRDVVGRRREVILVMPRSNDLWERDFLPNELFASFNVRVVKHAVDSHRGVSLTLERGKDQTYIAEAIEEEARARAGSKNATSGGDKKSSSQSDHNRHPPEYWCGFALRVLIFHNVGNSPDVKSMKRLIKQVQPHVCGSVGDEAGAGSHRQLRALLDEPDSCKIILKQYATRHFPASARLKIIPLGYFMTAFPPNSSTMNVFPTAPSLSDKMKQRLESLDAQERQARLDLTTALDDIASKGISWKDRNRAIKLYRNLTSTMIRWPSELLPASRRYYAFAFMGGMKRDRQDMIDHWEEWTPNFVRKHHGGRGPEIPLHPMIVTRMYSFAKFAPAGHGYMSLEAFRIHEVSKAGAIPVIVASSDEERDITFGSYVGHQPGDDDDDSDGGDGGGTSDKKKKSSLPPWIFAASWDEAVWKAQDLSRNATALDATQQAVVKFYYDSIKAAQKAAEGVVSAAEKAVGCPPSPFKLS